MMYTSQELMICDIGYKTPGMFWRVKRTVRKDTSGYIPQTTCMHELTDISRSAESSWRMTFQTVQTTCFL